MKILEFALLTSGLKRRPGPRGRNSKLHKSETTRHLFKSEFGTSPVSSLEVVLHVVVGLHPDPVGHLSVLLDLLSESFL